MAEWCHGCLYEFDLYGVVVPYSRQLLRLPSNVLDPDCLPADRLAPCTKCGRRGWSLPEEPMLDAASLPQDVDLFRVGDFTTVIIGSERFVEAVRKLGFEQDILFRELALR